jgi:hypothetical protein
MVLQNSGIDWQPMLALSTSWKSAKTTDAQTLLQAFERLPVAGIELADEKPAAPFQIGGGQCPQFFPEAGCAAGSPSQRRFFYAFKFGSGRTAARRAMDQKNH